MRNLDVLEQEKQAIVQKMNDAIKKNDADAFQASFVELCDKIQENILEQAKGILEQADQRILSDRGVRQLTSTEKHYYQALIEAMKSQNPTTAESPPSAPPAPVLSSATTQTRATTSSAKNRKKSKSMTH